MALVEWCSGEWKWETTSYWFPDNNLDMPKSSTVALFLLQSRGQCRRVGRGRQVPLLLPEAMASAGLLGGPALPTAPLL